MTKWPAGEETIGLLPTRRESFVNECRVMALLEECGPPIRFPKYRFGDPEDGALVVEMIDGQPLGPKRPKLLDPDDLDRVIAIAQTIGRFWPPSPNLYRLPITDHLRHHQARGTLGSDDVVTIACALAVAPIKWGFAHGDLSARNLIKEPSGDLAVIDWERAGIYPVGYDLGFLWYTTRAVPDARSRIEAAVPAKHRTSFLLSALLAALLHLDRALDAGCSREVDPDRVDADALITQLGVVAMEGFARG